jgi:hypothetical protein
MLVASQSCHFDVKAMLSLLIQERYDTETTVYSPIVRRRIISSAYCWCFTTMKYYYLSNKEPNIFEGQVSGRFHDRDQSYICRGTSLMILSFEDAIRLGGHYSDSPRLPWRLMILSCIWDMGIPPSSLKYASEAFLWAVHLEMLQVYTKLQTLSARVAALAVPSVCPHAPNTT